MRGDKVATEIKQKTMGGCINDVLSKHCWVNVIEGTVTRRIKILKTRLSHIEPNHKADETVIANETGEVEEKKGKEEHDAWMSCAGVFASD